MKTTVISTAIALALGLAVSGSYAQTQRPPVNPDEAVHPGNQTSRVVDRDPIEAEDFVEEVSAKNLAEIDSAKMALEEGGPAVKAYANRIIQDHTELNREIRVIASNANLVVSDSATLTDKAKALMLSVRDGQNFDEAYAEAQITGHENSIELYERAIMSDNEAIAAYAAERLPVLHEHLRMAQALKTQISSR